MFANKTVFLTAAIILLLPMKGVFADCTKWYNPANYIESSELNSLIEDAFKVDNLAMDFDQTTRWSAINNKNRTFKYVYDLRTPKLPDYMVVDYVVKKSKVSWFSIGRMLDAKYRAIDVENAMKEKLKINSYQYTETNKYSGHKSYGVGSFKVGNEYVDVTMQIHGSASSGKLEKTSVELNVDINTEQVEKYKRCIIQEAEEKRNLDERGKNLKL